MKRYVAVLLISMMTTGILSGCGHPADIGKEKATEIALEDANLTEEDVTRLRISKDRDDGESIYEVQFTSQNTEYEYEILASNGDILSVDYDESHTSNLSDQDKERRQDGIQEDDRQSSANPKITIEEASELALARVPGASMQDLKIEVDYDDGRQKYEGDIIYNQKEYEFEIDADTGDFLEWTEERR